MFKSSRGQVEKIGKSCQPHGPSVKQATVISKDVNPFSPIAMYFGKVNMPLQLVSS